MHESFYRTGRLYEEFNPVRLIDMDANDMAATIRRAATEATARNLSPSDESTPPPLNVFLSHAKRDGIQIAEAIRDGVRRFGQLEAWYDANDLPIGASWSSPMKDAAQSDTAAMIVTVTDAYPTRPWCRREARLARTPVQIEKETKNKGRRATRVWKVQPVIAVHKPGSHWVRGVPMLQGVPRIGWKGVAPLDDTRRVVDRLVLEVLLGRVHRQVALHLDAKRRNPRSCYITWIPDAWTLAALRGQLGAKARFISTIVYPGYGLTTAELSELQPMIETFNRRTQLVSFEEAWR
jgi:hypothetical protein